MFTGIVREIGTVTRVKRGSGIIRLAVQAPRIAALVQPMESIAVNGVCLTVVAARAGVFDVEMIPQTQRLTSLPSLRAGMRLNLEPSLGMTDRFNGHVVLGHVDGVGRVRARRQIKGELILEIGIERRLRAYLVPKGPVAVDGVSLTVGSVLTQASFRIHLIPETLRRTTLAQRQLGDGVNIEIDYFAKLVRQVLRANAAASFQAKR
jgi:riboflavin synthase